MNKHKWLATLAAGFCMCAPLAAQESDFDLSTQRSESQDVLMMKGKKLDHKGIIINPVPHQIAVNEKAQISLAKGVRIADKQGKFADVLQFIPAGSKGVKLTIDFGTAQAAKAGVKPVSGAYALNIGKQGIEITGYDERGAFYGIQTLRQLAESPAAANGTLPYVEINDYPDLPYRGVVEGFYGTPWSHEVRLSLIDFYGKFKLNSYLYGPKDDPYHSSPNWREPYPAKEAANIKELVEACNRNRVDFVWAIHPGLDIQWNETDYANLLNKFELMYGLGVRSFAIFFDDIEGEGTNPVKQTEWLNRLNADFVKVKPDVTPLVVCPTDYSKLWANPTPQGSLCIYGNTLDPSINVFWTGDVVCSDLTKETMDWVNSRIQRPGYYWWNYPVTDYVRHIIMQGPVYGLETSLTADDLCGLASNPMEHGEASKLALYGVADYTWNIAGYNPIDNWERGIVELTPEARDAYRTFAIHSCDTETGYRRAESWETETFRIADYNSNQFDALRSEFEKVAQTPAILEETCANQALVSELRPWLTEFGKLGNRGLQTLDLIKIYESGDNAAFWQAYVQNCMSETDKKNFEAHKSGTMKLHPFYENAMDDMASGFFTRLTGEMPACYTGAGSFNNLSTTLSKLMFDNDTTTHYTSGRAQKTGDWIGADLGCVRPVSEIEIYQGRNSTDDVDYFDHTILEYSANGKDWTALTDSLEKQYILHWTGQPVEARYVRIRKLPSQKTNWSTVRTFKVNPVSIPALGFAVEAADMDNALYAFDKNPGTAYQNEGTFSFGIPAGAKSCTLLLNPDATAPVTLKKLAANGSVISESVIDAPFCQLELTKEVAKIEINGKTEVFEVLFD